MRRRIKRGTMFTRGFGFGLTAATNQVAAIYLASHNLQVAANAVGHDHVGFGFELG